MPGSPIQEQIRAWIQISGREVANLEKSQKNETSRPTFVSSNLRKPPFGGFLYVIVKRPDDRNSATHLISMLQIRSIRLFGKTKLS